MRAVLPALLLAACLAACAPPSPSNSTTFSGAKSPKPAATPKATPTAAPSASPTSNPTVPAVSDALYAKLTLKLDGQEKTLSSTNERIDASGILTITLGNTYGETLPAGAYAITVALSGVDEAAIKPGTVNFNITVGNGQPLTTQYSNAAVEGTPTIDTVSAANGKLDLRFQGRLKCVMCEDGLSAPPKVVDVDLAIEGLALR